MTEVAAMGLDAAQARLGLALRARMGLGRAHSLAAVRTATGIPEAQLKAYRRGEATPSLHYFLRLSAYFGPDFLNEIVAPAGLGGARRLDGAAGPLELNAALAEAVALLGRHLKDGRICHRELAEEVALARVLMPLLGDFIAANDRPGASGPKVAVA